MLAVSEHEVTAAPTAEESHRLRDNPRKTECQVEGCRIALPKRKAYHKRYRICSYHSTLPQLVLEGRHMRFCQQCGRFQLLSEFEGDKRSCRAKLDLHNARRKQAREAAFHRNSDDDSSPARRRQSTPNTKRLKGNIYVYGNTSSSNDDDEGQDEESCSSGAGGDGVGRDGSSADGATGTTAAVAAYAAVHEIIHDRDIDDLLKDFVGDANAQVHIPSNGLGTHTSAFHPIENAAAGSTDDLLHQIVDAPILPIHLALPIAPPGGSIYYQNSQQRHASTEQDDLAPAFVGAAVPPQYPALLPQATTHQQQHYNSYQLAEELLSAHDSTNPAVNYEAPYDLVRVSFKLFNVHPAELPTGITDELQAIIQSSSFLIENARIGCTHLSVEALLSRQENAALELRGSTGLLNAALSRGHSFFPKHTLEGQNGKIVVQIGSEVSLKTGTSDPVHVQIPCGSSAALCVNKIMPVAVVPGEGARFKLCGSNIFGSQDMIVCRQGSNVPDLEVLGPGLPSLEGGNISSECDYVEFVLPRPTEGLHLVEVQRGSLLSPTALPFLVIDSADAVKELRQLEYDTAGVGNEQCVATFLNNVGVVLDWCKTIGSGDGADSGPSSSAAVAASPRTPADDDGRISKSAQRVAAMCIVRGWPALLRLVLPAMVPPGSDPATVIEEFKSYSKQGLSMLHLAALSRCAEVVQVLADWASQIGYTWRCEAAPTAAGLTPLHLACLSDDKGVMASVLTSVYPEGLDLWTTALTSDEARPIDFAICANNSDILVWLKKQGVVFSNKTAHHVSAGGAGAGAGAGAAVGAETSGDDEGASGSPQRLSDNIAKTKDEPDEIANRAFYVDETAYDTKLQHRHRISRSVKIGINPGSRIDLETLRTSYLDTVYEEIKLVEEEMNTLSDSSTADGSDGGDQNSGAMRQLLMKGALVVATASAAALAASLRTVRL